MMEKIFVHERALCDSKRVGEGTRIWAFTHVMEGARIGKHCNLGEHVFVENHVVIGDGCTIKNGVAVWDRVTLEDDVFVGPNAVFTNDFRPRSFIKWAGTNYLPTLVKRGASLGANVTIVCGVTIGEYAMVAAGSVVTRDIAPHTLVVGNPARPVGKICFCGQRLDAREHCEACGLALSKNSAAQAAKKFSVKI